MINLGNRETLQWTHCHLSDSPSSLYAGQWTTTVLYYHGIFLIFIIDYKLVYNILYSFNTKSQSEILQANKFKQSEIILCLHLNSNI